MPFQSPQKFQHPKRSECRIHVTVLVPSKCQKRLNYAHQELCLLWSPGVNATRSNVRLSQLLYPCDHRSKLCCELRVDL